MDPLAHTLLGAGLSETGLKRTSRHATATLVLAANAPDIDVVYMFLGEDPSLLHRRGLTHGIISLALLPFLIAGGMMLFARWQERRGDPGTVPARFLPLLGLATIGVLSHPLLDWMNTYGVRVLMPFDGRWFYGDALNIVDPWMWLLPGAGVVLATARGRWSRTSWLVLGLAASALVLLSGQAGPVTQGVWTTSLALLVLGVWRGSAGAGSQRVARAGVAGLVLYMGLMVFESRSARARAMEWMASTGETPEASYASALPANPFVHEVIVSTATHHHALAVHRFGSPDVRRVKPPIPRAAPGPLVMRALEAPGVQGTRNWLRIPAYRVEPQADGSTRVVIHDLRYDWEGTGGLGTRTVTLPRDPSDVANVRVDVTR